MIAPDRTKAMRGRWAVSFAAHRWALEGARPFLVGACLLAGAAGQALAQSGPAGPGTTPSSAPMTAPAVGGPAAAAPAATETGPAFDGQTYKVGRFNIRYAEGSPTPLGSSAVGEASAVLARVGDTFVAPDEAPPGAADPAGAPHTLDELSRTGPYRYSDKALTEISKGIVQLFNSRGVYGVLVGYDATNRPADQTELDLTITVALVKEMRTVASGDRLGPNNARVNNKVHERILRESPVFPDPLSRQPSANLLRKDELDEYVLQLNRHPGRRVDLAVSPAAEPPPGEPRGIALDYLVSENKPWSITAQASNTGTKATSEWRERFAFVDNQVTNNDDILTIDYSTANFQDSNVVLASYEARFFNLPRVRYRVYGTYNEFTASDVGFPGQNFDGEEYVAGGEVFANVLQMHDTFVDLFGGVRFQRARLRNEVGSDSAEGTATFVGPYVGVRAVRQSETVNATASVSLLYSRTGADREELDVLRTNADNHFALVQFEASRAFFLEPLLAPQAFRERTGSLAHELALSVRGQTTLGQRLIPQNEEVAGGLFSVRGYRESITAGDTVVLGTAEYRYHFTRGLPLQPDPRLTPDPIFHKPFRFAPQTPYGVPDWDLIGRVFVDAARVSSTDRLVFEQDNTLISTGVGLELLIKDNVGIRVDWGIALKDVKDVKANDGLIATAGSNRFHFVFTLSY